MIRCKNIFKGKWNFQDLFVLVNIVKYAIIGCNIKLIMRKKCLIVLSVSYNVITDLIQQIWSCQTAKRSHPRWPSTRSRRWWLTYFWTTWTMRTRHRPSFTRMSQESLSNLHPLLNKSYLNLVCLPPVWMEHWTWPIQCLYFIQCHVFRHLSQPSKNTENINDTINVHEIRIIVIGLYYKGVGCEDFNAS